ncbi:MAG: hypothetical protein ATN31_05155 [Candidatus Epulonipiscioides saccharophilum]|nr:MAG: hypothetical protein ATN31_05155 [Epulopiscium sp. AS2M-Bin001]
MNIIGHERIKNYFNKVIEKNKLSHSYIFEGKEGIGKKTLAWELAKLLLCEQILTSDNPYHPISACECCPACHLVAAKTHPDYIEIEKDTQFTKIDTIKEKLLNEIYIRPYKGKYKIFVINEAESLNATGQNAILKTIEEPPPYLIIILITTNIEILLPTVRSRCINLLFNDLSDTDLQTYCKQNSIPINPKQLKFAQGSIGRLKKQTENFLLTSQDAINILMQIYDSDVERLYQILTSLTSDKEKFLEILEFWKLFLRDMLLYKRVGSTDLFFNHYLSEIKMLSNRTRYIKIINNIELIIESITDIKANINIKLVTENLLLYLKKE